MYIWSIEINKWLIVSHHEPVDTSVSLMDDKNVATRNYMYRTALRYVPISLITSFSEKMRSLHVGYPVALHELLGKSSTKGKHILARLRPRDIERIFFFYVPKMYRKPNNYETHKRKQLFVRLMHEDEFLISNLVSLYPFFQTVARYFLK